MMHVELHIRGQIDENWSAWFEDLNLSHDSERDETLLRGEILDQAALYGLLAKLRDLGLGLVSVTVSEANGAANTLLGDANLDQSEALDT